MAEPPTNSGDLIARFVDLTSVSPEDAHTYLANCSWDLESAVTEFYNPQEELHDSEDREPSVPGAFESAPVVSAEVSSVPRVPPTVSSMAPAPPPPQQPKKKFATLGDLGGSSSGAHAGHGHDDDDEDDKDYDPNLYAGGEKSGLAVENPDELRRKIIERAKRNARRVGGDDERPPQSRFTGTARTLGGDDTPSEVIEDPNATTPRRPELITRQLHFWTDGFSVDDGQLYRLDDPRNAEILAQIKQGRAPMHILNVTSDQEVDVQLAEHNEPYVPPKKKYQPFSSGGQRLGSPSPAVTGNESSSTNTANTSSATPAKSSDVSSGPPAPTIAINESEPTISLQIRLGDGSRLVSRFNTTHTIGDVYNFVNSSSPASQSRSWVLMTTFPSKELNDKGQVLGDLAEFKRGGVIMQKWQ